MGAAPELSVVLQSLPDKYLFALQASSFKTRVRRFQLFSKCVGALLRYFLSSFVCSTLSLIFPLTFSNVSFNCTSRILNSNDVTSQSREESSFSCELEVFEFNSLFSCCNERCGSNESANIMTKKGNVA